MIEFVIVLMILAIGSIGFFGANWSIDQFFLYVIGGLLIQIYFKMKR